MPAYRCFDLVSAAFVAVLIISNIGSTKVLCLGPFTFDGGTLLFPVAYILGDIVTEVYGYARSRRVIWTGFAWLIVTAVLLAVIDALPAAADWPLQESFHAILGQAPRIVLASLIAFFAGEFSNSYILARLKVFTAGRHLWLRTIGSTLIGEALDTVIFLFIAFWGVWPPELWLAVALSNYVFKVGVEVCCTPATYFFCRALKRREGIDHFDRATNFNPFRLRD